MDIKTEIKIKLDKKDREIKLSEDEAKQLYNYLKGLFEGNKYNWYTTYPWHTDPNHPVYCKDNTGTNFKPSYPEITCNNNNENNFDFIIY